MTLSERNQLIVDNMNLVYFIINKYYPSLITDDDIKQVGMLGLIKAADKWDESKGTFATFASYLIRHEIAREFRDFRSKHTKDVSLQNPLPNSEEDGTYEDAVVGEEDVDVVDADKFYESLHGQDAEIIRLLESGYSRAEIAERFGVSQSAIGQHVRKLRKRWIQLYGDFS